jgi:YjbE family integral membrane protein
MSDIFSGQFVSALMAIVIIDLVLAGDNAIVIALAARNLRPELRRKAIIWGTVGAIGVRSAMTLAVVWLLRIPGLLFLGGAVLIWIAYKLLVDQEESAQHGDPARTFWGAMKTIVVADALMGLDNVLAVAGAAQGSFVLVVLGLVISIPIVIWGSQLVLGLLRRFPSIIYIGAAVLAWTAVKMMLSEPLLESWLAERPAATWGAYLAVMGGVLGRGFVANHRKAAARVTAHLVDSARSPVASRKAGITNGETDMEKILIPVDGSQNALKAVQHAVNRFTIEPHMEIHLLHVRTPLTLHAAQFISRRNRAAYHRDEAEKALGPARELLHKSGVPHAVHVEIGDKAATIDRLAQRLHATRIVMGTARKNSLTRLVEDSVTNKVLELASIPVEIVAGEAVSRLERIGVPAGIGAALALMLAAGD